jgi:hypothetical protein
MTLICHRIKKIILYKLTEIISSSIISQPVQMKESRETGPTRRNEEAESHHPEEGGVEAECHYPAEGGGEEECQLSQTREM